MKSDILKVCRVNEIKKAKNVEKRDFYDSAAWNSSTLRTLTEAFCSLTVVQWKLLIAVGGLSDANGSMELWDTSNNIIREIEYVNGTMDTSQVSKVHISHCSKMKVNGKKLSRLKFHFPGLLGTSLMSKQETIFFFHNWTSEIIPFIRFGKQMDGT